MSTALCAEGGRLRSPHRKVRLAPPVKQGADRDAEPSSQMISVCHLKPRPRAPAGTQAAYTSVVSRPPRSTEPHRSRGTEGSNPSPSSGESRANLIPRGSVSNASCGSGCAPASSWQVHRPVAASYSMIFARSGNRLSLDSRRFLAMALAVAVGRRAPLKYHHRTSSDRAPRDGDRAAR